MGIWEMILIGIGLSMDAFAVSVCKGLSVKTVKFKHYMSVGIWFGGFQALMPLIGYYLGVSFEKYVTNFDHWIAFALLVFIGGNMIKESRSTDEEKQDSSFDFKKMLMLAIATSIDALAVGITFAFLNANVFLAVTIIGITTFILSVVGIKIGNIFGNRYSSAAEMVGGIVLICIGLKILIEHLFNITLLF